MNFIPEAEPFPYWVGPYSLSNRGKFFGLSVRRGHLVVDEWGGSWDVQETHGISELISLVKRHFKSNGYRRGGGRVLFLPSGIVIKPLQEESDTGSRVVIGRFEGGIIVTNKDGKTIDISPSSRFVPRSPWQGPKTIGLKCTVQRDGSLKSDWKLPSARGKKEPEEPSITVSNSLPASGKGAKVHVLFGGHVITRKDEWDGGKKHSVSYYVGKIGMNQFLDWEQWIQGRLS